MNGRTDGTATQTKKNNHKEDMKMKMLKGKDMNEKNAKEGKVRRSVQEIRTMHSHCRRNSKSDKKESL